MTAPCTCQWPTTKAGKHVFECEQAPVLGQAYCADHRTVAYQPKQVRVREDRRIARDVGRVR